MASGAIDPVASGAIGRRHGEEAARAASARADGDEGGAECGIGWEGQVERAGGAGRGGDARALDRGVRAASGSQRTHST